MTVYLHGLGQTPAAWDKTLAALGEEDAQCPHMGQLLERGAGSYDGLYKAFEGYCGELDGKLELRGLSVGAILALHYALDHPERVSSLVLIAGRVKSPRVLLALQNVIFSLMPETAFAGSGLKKAQMKGLCRSMAGLNLSGRLGEVSCPTLVLCGDQDKANRKEAETLVKGIPGARLGFIPGAGHEVNQDAPEVLAKTIAQWRELGRLTENP